jgi:hypothetical protein
MNNYNEAHCKCCVRHTFAKTINNFVCPKYCMGHLCTKKLYLTWNFDLFARSGSYIPGGKDSLYLSLTLLISTQEVTHIKAGNSTRLQRKGAVIKQEATWQLRQLLLPPTVEGHDDDSP